MKYTYKYITRRYPEQQGSMTISGLMSYEAFDSALNIYVLPQPGYVDKYNTFYLNNLPFLSKRDMLTNNNKDLTNYCDQMLIAIGQSEYPVSIFSLCYRFSGYIEALYRLKTVLLFLKHLLLSRSFSIEDIIIDTKNYNKTSSLILKTIENLHLDVYVYRNSFIVLF